MTEQLHKMIGLLFVCFGVAYAQVSEIYLDCCLTPQFLWIYWWSTPHWLKSDFATWNCLPSFLLSYLVPPNVYQVNWLSENHTENLLISVIIWFISLIMTMNLKGELWSECVCKIGLRVSGGNLIEICLPHFSLNYQSLRFPAWSILENSPSLLTVEEFTWTGELVLNHMALQRWSALHQVFSCTKVVEISTSFAFVFQPGWFSECVGYGCGAANYRHTSCVVSSATESALRSCLTNQYTHVTFTVSGRISLSSSVSS